MILKSEKRALVDYLTGHLGEGTNQIIYTHGETAAVADLHEIISKVSFPEVEETLRHLET